MAVSKKSYSDRTVTGTLWLTLGTAAQAVIRIGTLAFLARMISPTDFGYMAAITTIISLTEALSNIGLAPALIQKKEITREDVVTAQTISVLLSVGAMIVNILLAGLIATAYNLPEIETYLRVVSIVFVLHGLSAIARALVARNLNFKLTAKMTTLGAFVGYTPVVLVLAWLGYGVWALVIATITQAALTLLLFWWQTPPVLSLWIHPAAARRLTSFGVGSSLAVVISKMSEEVDNFIVARTMGAGALGIYSRAFTLMAGQSRRLAQTMQGVIFPVLSRVQDEPERLSRGYRRAIAIGFYFGTPFSIVAWFFSEPLVNLLLGPNWSEVILPFAILGLSIGPRITNRFNAGLMKAVGRVYLNAGVQVVTLALYALCAWVGAQWGVVGVAVAMTLANWTSFWMRTAITIVLMKIPVASVLASLRPALVSAAIVTLVLVATRELSVSLAMPAWGETTILLVAFAISMPATLFLPQALGGPDLPWLRGQILQRLPGLGKKAGKKKGR